MKLAFSNIAWDPAQDSHFLKKLSQKGFTGLEIAPTKLFGADPYSCKEQAKSYSLRIFEYYGMEICSMQSLWFGQSGNIFQSEQQRLALRDYTYRAIEFAGAIGCKNMVFGNPKARNRGESREDAAVASFFADIGAFAASHGTCIALEPNPTIYGTDFINTTAQAAAYCRQLSCEGLKLNGDLGTVIHNNEDLSVFQANAGLINHIHISEPYLTPICPRPLHRQLRTLAYSGFLSVEMAQPEDPKTVASVIDYVAEVFSDD